MHNFDLPFKVENLGSIRSGEFTQKPLTVFCGPNNSGKTWAMYTLYSFFKLCEDVYEGTDAEDGSYDSPVKKNFINKLIAQNLHFDFNVPVDQLAGVRFDCNLDIEKDKCFARTIYEAMTDVFLMPAERGGFHLFFRELSTRRTALLHHASRKNIDIYELLKDVMHSRYAKPLAEYINWLNQMTEIFPGKAFHHEVMNLQKQIAGGRYHINRNTGDITFTPYQTKKGVDTKTLGLHSTSSAVKSLFGLWFYLEHLARVGDVLMIDEPEANMHPQNQLLLTHLLVRLVNQGINVVISTHSDYVVREVNNLIMLDEIATIDKKLVGKKGEVKNALEKINNGNITYSKDAFLSAEKVGMCFFDNNTISPMEYIKGQGFAVNTFDDVIVRQNETNLRLYHVLLDELDEMENE